jgi:hypothetical protein
MWFHLAPYLVLNMLWLSYAVRRWRERETMTTPRKRGALILLSLLTGVCFLCQIPYLFWYPMGFVYTLYDFSDCADPIFTHLLTTLFQFGFGLFSIINVGWMTYALLVWGKGPLPVAGSIAAIPKGVGDHFTPSHTSQNKADDNAQDP